MEKSTKGVGLKSWSKPRLPPASPLPLSHSSALHCMSVWMCDSLPAALLLTCCQTWLYVNLRTWNILSKFFFFTIQDAVHPVGGFNFYYSQISPNESFIWRALLIRSGVVVCWVFFKLNTYLSPTLHIKNVNIYVHFIIVVNYDTWDTGRHWSGRTTIKL